MAYNISVRFWIHLKNIFLIIFASMSMRDIGPMSQLFLPVSMWVVSHLLSVQESQPFSGFLTKRIAPCVAVGLVCCEGREGPEPSTLSSC